MRIAGDFVSSGRLFLLVVGLAVPSAASAQSITFTVRDDVDGCVRVRATPRSDGALRGCLEAGDTVRLLATGNYWRRVETVRTPMVEGWVAKKFLVDVPAGAATPSTETAIRDDAWLEIHFVDVGQGDAIWIHTFDDGVAGNGRYEGRNILIDGGPDASDAKNEFLKYLLRSAHEGAVVDALIVSHPHDDHYPGAQGILRHFEVVDYYDPGFPKAGVEWPAFRALVNQERARGQPVRQRIGLANFGTPSWGSEIGVQFLHASDDPDADDLGDNSTLENNSSIVMRLTYGEHTFLFMGDAEGKDREQAADQARYVERRLLANPGAAALRSTVLKIAHHGSETSSTLPFIQAVDPRYVIVTSGRRRYRGRYLPDSSTLARYCAHNPEIRIFRTDQDDAAAQRTAATDADGDHIVIRSNGRSMLVQGMSSGVPITATSCQP